MNSMISVIIPAYNREHTIDACIQSVLAQRYQNFEIIVIDDGSCDATADICKTYCQKDSRVRLLCSGHGGVSAARNLGLDASKGAFLFFLDSDDVIHPELLEVLVRDMENSGASMGGTCVKRISQKDWQNLTQLIDSDCGPGETAFYSHEDTVRAVFQGKTPLNMIGGVMMRRNLVGNTRFREDLFIGEDFYFIYENLIKGASSVFLKQIWYYERLHADNISWNFGFDGFWSRFLRRKLVWQSEETLGRPENAVHEKRSAFDCFVRCMKSSDLRGEDAAKMRRVMKEHKAVLFPAFTLAGKVSYCLSIYCPRIYLTLLSLKRKLRRH